MILILKKICKDLFCTFLLVFFVASVPASAQQFLEPFKVIDPEIIDRYKNLYKETVSGDSYNPADGSVLFQVTDISIPGNFDLPVELTRWIPVEDMMTSDLAGWTWNIPFIRGYYIKHHGNGGTVTASEPTAGLAVGKNCDGSYAGVLNVSNRFEGWGYGLYPSSYWDGKLLHIPGKTSEKFLERPGFPSPSHQVTKSNYYIEACINSNVENEQGMLVRGPDGTKYTFNQIKTYPGEYVGYASPVQKYNKLIMVSRIEDRFGNFVNYNYNSNGDLESIVASDGRQINVYYESYVNSIGKTYSRAAYAEANGRRWKYIYSPTENPIYRKNMLSEVKLPDESKWKYDDHIYDLAFRVSTPGSYGVSEEVRINNQRIQAQCHKTTVTPAEFSTTVVSPTGVSTQYTFRNVYHGRAEVNPQLYPRNYPGSGFGNSGGTVYHIRNMSCKISHSLISKVISGAGLASQNWSYNYSGGAGSYQSGHPLNQVVISGPPLNLQGYPSNITNAQHVNTTMVTGPDSKIIYYVDRLFQSPTEGDIVAEDHKSLSDNSLLKRVEYSFVRGNYIGENWYVGGGFDGPTADSLNSNKINYRVNKTKSVIKQSNQGGVDNFETEYTDYDIYGFARKTIEKNSFSTYQRYIKKIYLHDDSKWIIGLPISTSISNTDSGYSTINEIVYHTSQYADLYLPYEYKEHGTWLRRYPEYHEGGQLKRIEYNQLLRNSAGALVSGKYRYQVLTDYKRGKAQNIQTAQRYSDTASMSFSRVVNDDGWVTSITDLNGVTALYDYDKVGRLKSVDLPSGWQDTFVEWQEPAGQTAKRISKGCTLTADRLGCVAGSISLEVTSEFDALYRIKSVDEHDVLTSVRKYQNFKFDSQHSPIFTSHKSVDSAVEEGTTNTYDNIGRLRSSMISNGGITTYEYLSGNKIRITDAEGNETTTTYLAYGAPEYNQMLNVASPEGVTTTQVINIFGNVTNITQAGPGKNGTGTVSLTEYRAYDAMQHLCKITRNDVGTTLFSNNVLGEVQALYQDVVGNSANDCINSSAPDKAVKFAYDNLGGKWKIDYPDTVINSAPDLVYTLDNNGNVKTLRSGSVFQTYNYNILGLLEDEHLQVNGKSFFIDYEYNSAGYLAALTYPDGDKIEFNPNGFGEARQAIRKAGVRPLYVYANNVNYYPNGFVDSFDYGNGVSHKVVLNNQRLPESVKDSRSGFTALHYGYTYNDNLKVTSISDYVDTSYSITNLTYDGLGRLSATTGNGGIGNSQMKYDGLGNITYYKNKKHSLDYSYNINNRLQSVASSGAIFKPYSSFSYDDRGNVVNNSHNSFEYNRANQMVVSGNNQYTYDGYNRRVMSMENGKISYSFYSQSGQLLYSEGSDGGINYIFLNKKLIAKDGFIPQNAGRQHHLPFGASIEGEINDVGYTGHKFDKSLNLSYMQARYYDPVLGRFYSNDPVGFTGDVETFNRYSYVGNDPVNKNDPTGEFANLLIGAGIGIVAEIIVQTVVEGKSPSQIDGGRVLKSAAVGALSGGVGGATARLAGSVGRSIAAPASAMHQGASKVVTGAATGAIGGATGAAAGDAATQLVETGTVDPSKVAATAVKGAITGGLSGAAGGAVQANATQKTLGDARAQTLFTSAEPGARAGAAAAAAVDAATSAADAIRSACQLKPNGC